MRRLILFVFLASCLLISCGRHERVKVLPPVEIGDRLPEVSDTLSVDVFLDGTLSMKGFTVPGVTSRYVQTIQLLERAAQKGWDKGSVIFYKFGSRIDPIAGRAYLEAAKPSFYSSPREFQKTYIEKVIDFPRGYVPPAGGIITGDNLPNGDNLKVIVTDLFQDSADVALLTKSLKENYLAKNLAVGVLGIKSEFAGKVYDVGPVNYTFDYASGDSPEKFRPFYVLIL
jgi:hypothetical protein